MTMAMLRLEALLDHLWTFQSERVLDDPMRSGRAQGMYTFEKDAGFSRLHSNAAFIVIFEAWVYISRKSTKRPVIDLEHSPSGSV